MVVNIKGDDMGNISVDNGSLFIMTEGGKPMPLENVIEIEAIEEHSKNDRDETICRMRTSGGIEIDFTPDYYLNQKVIAELFFGITNNYRRMHGGFALREQTKYKWHKRHKKRKE